MLRFCESEAPEVVEMAFLLRGMCCLCSEELKARGWNPLKVSLLACLVVDDGCQPGLSRAVS